MGSGLLIGTALIVIIPEGVATMYSAAPNLRSAAESQGAMEAAQAALHKVGSLMSETSGRAAEIAGFSKRAEPIPHEHVHESAEGGSHAWVGISLITGFLLMYLIDELPGSRNSQTGHQAVPMMDPESPASSPGMPEKFAGSKFSTTVGLLIHSLADGVALGASAGHSHTSLGFVVFAAILVHKAPAAFGLTSVLLKQGFGKRTARAHLLAFSLAAPVGALVTWILVTLLGAGVSGASQMWWTGLVLVFSGGTFL